MGGDRVDGCALTIIIVAWNVAELLEQCLDAVERHRGELQLEIIVVDNASSDDTLQRLRARPERITVIRNAQNVGFPKANNQALQIARGDYVLFLNPDTEVGAGTLQACVQRLAADPGIGIVGCKLLLPDGTIQYECARRAYRLQHLLWEALYLHMLFPRSRRFGDYLMSYWNHEGSREVEAVSGAFLMARREVARGLGGLPEDLFMYHEDVAFCVRAARLGWRTWYEGGVSTLHHHARSSAKSPLRLDLLATECRFLLIAESQGRAAMLAARVLWAIGSALRLAGAATVSLLPRTRALQQRYPAVFDLERHGYQIAWALAPWLLRGRLPAAPGQVSSVIEPVNGVATA